MIYVLKCNKNYVNITNIHDIYINFDLSMLQPANNALSIFKGCSLDFQYIQFIFDQF